MRIISTRTHAMTDYPLGIILLLAPNLFGFSEVGGAAVTIPRLVGLLIILTSLITKYEGGVVKVISMVNHLRLDYLAALLLALSPILFGFIDEEANAWLPHILVGLGYFAISMMTKGSPDSPAAEV